MDKGICSNFITFQLRRDTWNGSLRKRENPTFQGLVSEKSSLKMKVTPAALPHHSILWDTDLDSNKPDVKHAFLLGNTKSGYQNDNKFVLPRQETLPAEMRKCGAQISFSGRRRDIFTGSAAGQGKLQSLNVFHVITLSAVLKLTRCLLSTPRHVPN